MICRLSKDFFFEAAHHLPNAGDGHPCRGPHGHSYRVEVVVEGPVDPKPGWVCDYGQISAAAEPIVRELDHRYLNEIIENPTSEMLCGWLWERLKPGLPGLCEITVQETPRARCTYRGK